MPKGFLKKLGKWFLDRGADFGEETLEELAQSSSTGILEMATGTPSSDTTFAQEYGSLEDAANTELTILITVGLFGLNDLGSNKADAITYAYEQGNLGLAATMTAEEIDRIIAQNTASAEDAEIFRAVKKGIEDHTTEQEQTDTQNIVPPVKPGTATPNINQQTVTPQAEQQAGQQQIQAQDEGTALLQLANIDPNAVSEPEVQTTVNNTAQEIKALAEETQADLFNDDVKNAYYKFRINSTNANAEAFYNTSIQNIDTAIAAEQKVGADTSALEELKGKMESAKSGAAQAQPDTEAQIKRVETERNMTRAVSALTNLPAEVQTQADAGAARQALYGYMKADESGKAAAYSEAAEQLRKSISTALETGKLDAGTRQRLEEILDNIDSGEGMGDNKNNVIDFNLVKEYIQDIEKRTGMKIPKNQIEELKNALRNKEYRKISKKKLNKHRNEFKYIKDRLIIQWEEKTGQKWPVYEEDIISTKTGEPYIKAGQYYDAHHIIECSYGGDNAWWNIHPARNPDIHQSGIHGVGSSASRLFDGGNYDY